MHVYRYAKVNTLVTTRTFAIVIEIPLTHEMTFTRFEVIPIAFEHDGHFILPKIEHKNVWLNELNNIVYLPTEGEIKNCSQTTDTYMCEQSTQMYSTLDISELQLFKNVSASNCTYVEMESPEEWRKIRRNEWLFSMKNEVQAEIMCEEDVNVVNISHSGVLKFNTGCSLKTQTSYVKTMKMITTESRAQHTIQVHALVLPGKVHINGKKFAEKIKNNIETLKVNDSWQYWHNCHHYFVIYCILFAIPIIVTYFYVKLEIAPVP